MGERGDGKGFTSLFGPLDETERGTIFDGPSRVHELCFAENFASRLVRERVDTNLSSQRFLVKGGDEVHARGDHGRGVDERRDGRPPGQCVLHPREQRQLGGLADRTDEAVDGESVRVRLHRDR